MRLITFCLLCILFSSCRKNEQITDDPSALLNSTQDTLLFDTIFSSVGSITKKISLRNPNNKAINISEIKLSGGSSSAFSININGISATERKNLVLNGSDSVGIFVKVTINPTSSALPFLVQDSIIISYNGNKKTLQLLGYGQNAVFINGGVLKGNVNWTNNLPYVISGSPTLSAGSTLNIAAGSRVYFHSDASLNIEGTLNANGSTESPVLFCSDRLESIYNDQPGQWKGLYIKSSGNAVINNTVIKNASAGITSDSLSQNAAPKIILANSIIKNMQVAAYIGNHSELNAFNCLMYNCGNYLIYGIGGGTYNLKQNTFAGYNPDFPRKTAALTFSDYLSDKVSNNLQLNLTNNIIYGTLSNELDIQKKTAALIQSVITNNLIRTTNTTFSNGNIINTDPLFVSLVTENFQIQATSPVHNKGTDLSSDIYYQYLSKDIGGNVRFFPSSLGCYEKK